MTAIPETARGWVDVDLGALTANARALAAASGARLLPMVKANGYGLGAVAVARALEPLAPWGYGVATPDEGRELREAGVTRPVVAFTPLLPMQVERFAGSDLRPAVGDPAALEAWLAGAPGRPFHLEIDTGMSRGGVRWDDAPALDRIAALLAGGGAGAWEGVFTHFHSADCEPGACAEQWERLHAALGRLPGRPPLVHAANSAGALLGAAYAGDLVRPGIYLYGAGGGEPAPRPVASLRARVVACRRLAAGDAVSYGRTWRAERPATVATLSIGYADGVLRALGNRGHVELGGAVVPIVGRVTMDMTMVAVPDDLRPPRPGDVATVFGGPVALDAQAEAAGTIAYELLTALGRRLPRRYVREDAPR
jgi:alanine racemase